LRKAWWNTTHWNKQANPSSHHHRGISSKQVPAKPLLTMQRNQEENPPEARRQRMSPVIVEHSQESERGAREGIRPRVRSEARVTPQKANGCKETAAANGTRTNKKHKTIAQQMDQDNEHAWLIQETWLTGNVSS
jgi:hypothetical protein